MGIRSTRAPGARPVDWLRAVADDAEMAAAHQLAMHLWRFAKGSGPDVGKLFASQADLAARLKLKERRVRDLLHELIEHGYLEQTRRGGYVAEGRKRASEYRLTLPSTGTQGPVEEDPTGNALPVGAESQPAMSCRDEREPTGTQGPPKREVLTREKSSSAASEVEEAADHIINTHRLELRHHPKVSAALESKPDPWATAERVTSEPLSGDVRSPHLVVLARIKADGGTSSRYSGGAPAPASTFKYTGSVSF